MKTIITQSILAAAMVGTTAYMMVTGISVSDAWWALVGAAIAYFFPRQGGT